MIDFDHGVALKPLDSKHSEIIRDWRNNPKIWKWCRQYDVISDLEQERWFRNQPPDTKMYAIFSGGEIVGVCGFTSIDHVNSRAEFSLYIGPEFQGARLGEKALKTLLSHGFMNHGFNSIWGETFAGNPAAKTFERIGMTKDGTRREFYFRDGKFIDAHIYSITSKEWK